MRALHLHGLLFGLAAASLFACSESDPHSDADVDDAATPSLECSGHGHLHGDHCHCDPGYQPEGDDACVAAPRSDASADAAPIDADASTDDDASVDAATPECGGNGHLHDDHCHCDPGYQAQDDTCVPAADSGIDAGPALECGGHGHLHGDHCHCDAGYQPEDDTCVAIPTPQPPELPRYTLMPIGHPGFESQAVALNDARQVAGTLKSATRPVLHTFRWTYDAAGGVLEEADVMADQGNNQFSRAYAIDAQGVVVGEANNDSARAFRWQVGDTTLRNLGRGVAANLGADGRVIGWSSHSGSLRAVRFGGEAVVQDLGSLDGLATTTARAYAVNAAGDVVGQSLNQTGVSRATLWKADGSLVNLGFLRDGKLSRATALNDAGEVVGAAVVSESGTDIYNAFSWKDGTIRNLGTLPTLPGAVHSEARAINHTGWVVGEVTRLGNYTVGEAAAVVWIDQQIFDLNAVLPADSGWQLLSARAINRGGDIAGVGRHEGVVRAFLLLRQP